MSRRRRHEARGPIAQAGRSPAPFAPDATDRKRSIPRPAPAAEKLWIGMILGLAAVVMIVWFGFLGWAGWRLWRVLVT